MKNSDIQQKIDDVAARIRLAADKNHREYNQIRLLAVSKTRPPEALRAAHAAGLTAFGENYLQEALDKIEALRELPLEWHFIGPIQSNKTRNIATTFDWVHSVDRYKIARRLAEQRPSDLPPLNICLQVNVSGEDTKSGVKPDQLTELLEHCRDLPNLRLRGLMAIPAPARGLEAQRRPFARLRELLEENRHLIPDMDTLSMGMSADLEAAIAEGSTLVRVGTDIFGSRGG